MALVHKIWLGDSIELCEKFKVGRVDCVITDPPYGTNNLSKSAETPNGKVYARKIANDTSPEIAVATFKKVMNVLLPKTADDCDMYVFTSYQVIKDWLVMTDDFMPQHGFSRKAILIWEKNGPGMGDLNVPWGVGMEFILYFQKGKRDKDVKRRNSVIHIDQVVPGKLIHPHEKPVQLLVELIKASTKEGDFIVDPFGGSGSLVRAAQRVDRSAVAIEYDEFNYQQAINKLEGGEGAGMDF